MEPPPPESLTIPWAAAFSLIGLSKSPVPCPCVYICTVISFSTCPLYPVSVFLLATSLFFYQSLAGWPLHGPYTFTSLSCEWNATLSLLLATGPYPSCFSLLGKCPGLAPARTVPPITLPPPPGVECGATTSLLSTCSVILHKRKPTVHSSLLPPAAPPTDRDLGCG